VSRNLLVERTSKTGFATPMERLVRAIGDAGMTVFASIDHAAAARAAGLEMPQTVVLLFGNPRGGTPVMLAAPRAAPELPLRVMLREGKDGAAVLSFHPVGPPLREAGVPEDLAARLAPSQKVVLKALRP
jgi:uncharacterized protein (DUF302 family)